MRSFSARSCVSVWSLILAAAPAAAATLTVGPGRRRDALRRHRRGPAQRRDRHLSGHLHGHLRHPSRAHARAWAGAQDRPHRRHPRGEKGIYVIDADGVTIENLELTGAHIAAGSGDNGAGIRTRPPNLTVRDCYIHDNQDGILGAPGPADGTVLIENSEFAHNGTGDGCTTATAAPTTCTSANFQRSPSGTTGPTTWRPQARRATCSSRAPQQNYILYNRFTGEDGTDSYEIDIPQGGSRSSSAT